MRRGRLLLFWIAFATLFAQQGALLHVFSHVANSGTHSGVQSDSAGTEHSKLPSQTKVCDQCLAFAQIGTALLSASWAMLDAVSLHAESFGDLATVAIAAPRAYLSRAPPHLV